MGSVWYQTQGPRPVNETNRLHVGFLGKRPLFAFLRRHANSIVPCTSTFILCLYPGTSPSSRFWFEETSWEDASWAKTDVVFTGPFSHFNCKHSITTEEIQAVFLDSHKARKGTLISGRRPVTVKTVSLSSMGTRGSPN